MVAFLYKLLAYLYEPLCYRRSQKYLIHKESWVSIQKQELAEILNYANRHCEYYHQFLDGKSITASNAITILKTLPLLDKNIIRTHKVHSDEITPEWKNWANTGGSTGEPLKFPRKGAHKSKRWEHINQMMLYIKMGYKPFDKIVSFDGLRVDNSLVSNKIFCKKNNKNFPYGIIRYSVLYLDRDTIQYYINSLNNVCPKFIRSYPSGLLLFCKFLKESGLSLNIKLKGCYLTSENFSQQDKNYISNVLNCPVWGQYGHTECSVFATQEPQTMQYLCSPLYGYTEVINDEGKQVQIGDIGSLVVTGFNMYGLPFIRYKTGDLAVYGGETKYGEVILTKLFGRDSDFIYDKYGEKVYLVGLIFGAHMHAFDCIDTWQIIQNNRGDVMLKIVKGAEFTQDSENELMNFFKLNEIGLSIEYVSSIEKTNRGKQKFLIQNIKK